MMPPEFVLEPLRVAGCELRLFAPVKPGGIDVAAALMTWASMNEQSFALAEQMYRSSHMPVTEDAWYDKAQAFFNAHKAQLVETGISEATVAELRDAYFEHHPNPEIETWLSDFAVGVRDASPTALYH
jgi:hypothetical protein